MEYPKINSLYKREGCGPYDEEKHRYQSDLENKPRKSPLIIGEYACPEFESINRWTVTEKVDGTNVRIYMDNSNPYSAGRVIFKGRTENAQFPTFLLTYLQETFTFEKMKAAFPESKTVILYGEGYGPKIQSGGYYRKDISFILFDVWIDDWWLQVDDVCKVAVNLGIMSVPLLVNPYKMSDIWTINDIVEYVRSKPHSRIAKEVHEMEGIIARSEPQMLFRMRREPIMFKLKCKDF